MYVSNVNALGYNSLNRIDELGAMPNICVAIGGPKHLDLDNVRNQETFSVIFRLDELSSMV